MEVSADSIDLGEIERLDALVAEMVGETALCMAYVSTIRRVPETAAGFGKLAAKHQARIAVLADEISAGVGRLEIGPVPARIRVVR